MYTSRYAEPDKAKLMSQLEARDGGHHAQGAGPSLQ